MFATLFSRWLGRWRGAIAALACIAVYTILVGAGASVMRAALSAGLTMLADCGYAPVNPPEWIEKLSPEVVLLSVAAGDREGRPDPETLEAVQGYTLLRTDRKGWIEITTDGEQMWLEAERR